MVKRQFSRFAGLLGLSLLAAAPLLPAAESVAALLLAAGNAGTESERLTHLRTLGARAETENLLDVATRRELSALLPVVEAWAEGRARARAQVARGEGEVHRYLHRFFEDATMAWDPPFPVPPRRESPLYPVWAFYRGRFLAWCMLEDSSVQNVPARKAAFVGEAERCFELARSAFPENAVLKIYGGDNVPIPDGSPWDDRAPAWANHQRRALEQLHKIIRWWIAERQLENGEFGGKWGDDVEMWRWWAPLFIGFDDPVVNAAQERLARGNLARPALAAGYTSQLTDVEHTAEETADTLTPMLHAAGAGGGEWDRRTRRLLVLADSVWWGENARGRLQFKHIDFNHAQLGADPGRAYDTGYHVRVLQPALLLWQRTGDPALGAPLVRWLRTWAEAALGTDNGKPAGIVPAALHFPSGRVGSSRRGWIGPDMAGDAMAELYSWPAHPVAALTSAMLQAHVQTGEPVFLEPLLQMAELRRLHIAAGDPDGPAGSLAWAAHRLPEIINDALAKWRQWSGDARFDDLLRADANGYIQRVLGADDTALTAALAAMARTLSYNWPMFTDEVRYTDRVLAFPATWPRTVATGLQPVDAALLYSTVTGDPGRVVNFPLNGARWHTLPRDFAALVTENQRARFAASLYHFGPATRALAVSLHLLEPGRYLWRVAAEDGRTLSEGELAVTHAERRLALTLPARTSVRLTLQRQ